MDIVALVDRSPAFLAVVALLALGEYLWHRQRGSDGYDLRESAATLGVMVGQIAIRTAGIGLIAPLMFALYDRRLFDIDAGHGLGLVGLFFGVELAYYWFHRLSHRVRFMWASHAVHHSSTRLNLTAAFRLGWTNLLTGSWVLLMPLIWLGFHPVAVLGMFSLNLTYQLFLHTELVGRLGPLEWVLNTPNHHRVHHGSDADCIDRNFGGMLIIFDRLFGTFASVEPGRKLRYGVQGGPVSYNPLRIAFAEWGRLFRDMAASRHPWQALRIWVGRP